MDYLVEKDDVLIKRGTISIEIRKIRGDIIYIPKIDEGIIIRTAVGGVNVKTIAGIIKIFYSYYYGKVETWLENKYISNSYEYAREYLEDLYKKEYENKISCIKLESLCNY